MPESSIDTTPGVPLSAMQRGMLGRILGSSKLDAMPEIREHGVDASPHERLNVYVRGYFERLCECLAADFPSLRSLVGEQIFVLFARGYLAWCPSRSRSLYDLGAGFADYLEESRPSDGADALDCLPSELARLERARTEAHRARGSEGTVRTDVSALNPMMPHFRLVRSETLRLVRSSFALKDVLDAVDRGERPAIPSARPAFYAVARANYRVAIHELSQAQFAFVEACSGGDLACALAAARLCDRQVGDRQVGDRQVGDRQVGDRQAGDPQAVDPQAGDARSPDMLAWMSRAIDAGLLTAHP